MRQRLTEAIKRYFLVDGSDFQQGFIYRINGSGLTLPCLWVNPLEMVGKTGRCEGVISYKIVLYIFIQNEKYSEQEKEQRWSQMEAMAIKSVTALAADDDVGEVSGFRCTPDEFAYTGFGELSLKVDLTIGMRYCDGCN